MRNLLLAVLCLCLGACAAEPKVRIETVYKILPIVCTPVQISLPALEPIEFKIVKGSDQQNAQTQQIVKSWIALDTDNYNKLAGNQSELSANSLKQRQALGYLQKCIDDHNKKGAKVESEQFKPLL